MPPTHLHARFAGPSAPDAAPADLLIEVPHAAWRRAHYEAVHSQLRGPLPEHLEDFFAVNTDVGAEALALAVAQGLVERAPHRAVEVLLCRVPRTFVDCNRVVDHTGGDLAQGGLTPGLAPYIEDTDDQALLRQLHADYSAAAEAAYDRVCGAGGLALTPHSYAPRTVGIDRIEADIVSRLHACWAEPERWPLRPEVDLITADAEGRVLADPVLVAAVRAGYEALGHGVAQGHSYHLHPATTAHAWSARYPGQVLCLELRRDLLVRRWEPFAEMAMDGVAVDRLARPLVDALHAALERR